ncbi:MAG TPA: hypothetical protein VMB25_25790 [Bryobacteraceae bacterium]|nr:hypothetical protein [Bryobacteraceae bacterium]
MAAGVSDHVWEIGDIIRLLEGGQAREVEQDREARTDRQYNPFGPALGF